MKRFFAAFVAVLLLFSLVSCGSEKTEYPLSVNGTPINGEIFTYYLDRAYSDSEGGVTRADRITYATNMCIRYVALNSTFAQKGLSLSPADSVVCSDEANALWSMYHGYYESLGVSKETFVKIRLSEAYRETLRLTLFDEGGTSPIPDSELKAYFDENYVAFKLIRGYLFTTDVYGNEKEYTDEELKRIKERYDLACEQINNKGTAIDLLYSVLAGSGEQDVSESLKTEVITDGSAYYPKGFYDSVRAVEKGKAAVLMFDDYIYLVNRVDALADDSVFKNHRSECLKAVSEQPLSDEIDLMCNAYTSVRNTAVVEKYCELTKKVRANGTAAHTPQSPVNSTEKAAANTSSNTSSDASDRTDSAESTE